MTNVFEGQPDGRQSDDLTMRPSIFRPRYRALTEHEKALHDAIKTKAAELEELFGRTAPAPMVDGSGHAILSNAHAYEARAMEALELAVMWAVKGLTS